LLLNAVQTLLNVCEDEQSTISVSLITYIDKWITAVDQNTNVADALDYIKTKQIQGH